MTSISSSYMYQHHIIKSILQTLLTLESLTCSYLSNNTTNFVLCLLNQSTDYRNKT